MRFGEWLKEERLRRGLSWSDMEAKTGMSTNALRNIEDNAKARPRFETIVKIVDGLEVPRETVWKMTGGNPQDDPRQPRLTNAELATVLIGAIDELNEPTRSIARSAYNTLAILLRFPPQHPGPDPDTH